MREVEINSGIKKFFRKTKLVIHDDIDQLPIDRFNKINKYWMLNDNIGSTFQDIDNNHIAKLILVADNKEKVIKEIENLRILIYNVIKEVNPTHMAFACMIHSIDGVLNDDLSEEGIRKTLKKLNDAGVTEYLLKKKMKEVRMIIYSDLELLFPALFNNVLSIAFWTKMKERSIKVCQAIIEGRDIDEDMKAADRYFATLISPKRFSGNDNEELKYDKYFEKNCIMLANMVNQPVKHLSTKEYFSLITYFNEKVRENGRRTHPQGRHN
jgi:hypothetical protein